MDRLPVQRLVMESHAKPRTSTSGAPEWKARPWVLCGAASLMVAVALAACAPPDMAGAGAGQRRGAGPDGRPQALGLTPEQELSLGEQAYREILNKSQVEPPDSSDVRRVRRVGRRIARASEIEPLEREINLRLAGYTFEWEFNVIRDEHVNVFCLPGGKVAVFSGLLPVAKTDDFLATVLGHEIGHALAHHASERVARQLHQRRFLEAANGVLGNFDPAARREFIGVLAAGAQVGGLKYDRQQEAEADHIGIFLMTFAGYDPRQAVVFWQRMQQVSRGGHVPKILSDHPSDAERMANMEKWVPQALAAKKAFDEGRIAPRR
jgi:predicted Zn-dependent protease